MKKIIAAFDGLNFSQSTLDYAVFFAKQAKAELVGVFLDDFMNHSYELSEIINEKGAISDHRLQELNQEEREIRDIAAELFEDACFQGDLKYKIHRDKNVALQELLHESIYSDLLIINKKEDFSRFHHDAPTEFLRDLLANVHCPVMIVPDRYKKIDEVILLYDGEPASVKAIKMLSYTLPLFDNKRIEILTVKNEQDTLHVPDGRLMREFMKARYPLADFVVERGNAKEEILRYLQGRKKNAMVALGAYGRGLVSRLLKPSTADLLIKELDIPVFIAH